MARLIDFGTSMAAYRYLGADPQVADYRAIWSDWWAVGDDLRHAMKHVGTETEREARSHPFVASHG